MRHAIISQYKNAVQYRCRRQLFTASMTDSKGNPITIQQLAKPLGVRERPTILEKTVKERAKHYLDIKAVEQDRAHLYGEILLL